MSVNMVTYIALVRAANVGGTGMLPMAELQAMCREAGFGRVRTYIASGNVIFESATNAKSVKAELETRLSARACRPVDVIVRTASEMAAVLKANPFAKAAPNRTLVIFLNDPPPKDALARATGVQDEEMRLGEREIYVRYGERMGISKLKIPAAKAGTGRNINTIAKLTEMASQP